MTRTDYISKLFTCNKKNSEAKLEKYLLQEDYIKTVSTYTIGQQVSKYIIGDISIDDDMFEFVYFLYDMNENFVGCFSKEQLDQMQND